MDLNWNSGIFQKAGKAAWEIYSLAIGLHLPCCRSNGFWYNLGVPPSTLYWIKWDMSLSWYLWAGAYLRCLDWFLDFSMTYPTALNRQLLSDSMTRLTSTDPSPKLTGAKTSAQKHCCCQLYYCGSRLAVWNNTCWTFVVQRKSSWAEQ